MTGRTRRPCHGTTLHITCYTRPTDGPCSAYSPSTMRASSTDTQQTRTSAQATTNPEQTTRTHDHSPRQRPYDTHGTAFRQIAGHNIFSRHTRASLGHAHRQESSRATARHRQGRYLWRSVPAGRTGAMHRGCRPLVCMMQPLLSASLTSPSMFFLTDFPGLSDSLSLVRNTRRNLK